MLLSAITSYSGKMTDYCNDNLGVCYWPLFFKKKEERKEAISEQRPSHVVCLRGSGAFLKVCL